MADTDAAVDGRTARALRNRSAIADACIALVEEGDVRPTATRIASRAGLSVRSVFQHYEDLERLYAAVADRLVERVASLLVTLDPARPRAERITQFVHQRSLLLEAITPIRRAADAHAPFSAEVCSRLQSGHRALRAEVEQVFGPELGRLAGDERPVVLDGLSAALSWPVWEALRSRDGRTPDEARAVVAHLVRALLTRERRQF